MLWSSTLHTAVTVVLVWWGGVELLKQETSAVASGYGARSTSINPPQNSVRPDKPHETGNHEVLSMYPHGECLSHAWSRITDPPENTIPSFTVDHYLYLRDTPSLSLPSDFKPAALLRLSSEPVTLPDEHKTSRWSVVWYCARF